MITTASPVQAGRYFRIAIAVFVSALLIAVAFAAAFAGSAQAAGLKIKVSATPASPTTSTSLTITWKVKGGKAKSAVCTLDGKAVKPCKSGMTLTGLAVGAHKFVVTVTPKKKGKKRKATYAWTVLAPPFTTPTPTPPAPPAPDTTPPSSPVVAGGSSSWVNEASDAITGSGSTDNVGVDHYEFRTSVDEGDNWTVYTTGSPATITAEGETVVQFRAVDAAGNASAPAPATPTAASTVRLDRTDPTDASVGGGSSSWTNNASVVISGSSATDNIAVDHYEYRSSTDDGSSWSSYSTGDSVSITDEGTTIVQFRAVDAAGNASDPAPDPSTGGSTAKIDRTDPDDPTDVIDPGPLAVGSSLELDWTGGSAAGTSTSSPVKVQFCVVDDTASVADCTSGAQLTWTDPSSQSPPATTTGLSIADGQWYGCMRSIDDAGNVTDSMACGDGFLVDSANPVAPTDVTVASGDTYWTTPSELPISWTEGSDAVAYDGGQYCVTIDSDGSVCGEPGPDNVKTWTDFDVGSTNVNADSFSANMTDGTWYGCVRSKDTASNYSAAVCDSVVVDGTNPSTPLIEVSSGDPVTEISSQLDLSYTEGSDTNYAASQYCVTSDIDGSDCAAGASGTVFKGWTEIAGSSGNEAALIADAFSPTDLTEGNWYGCVQTIDLAGNASTIACDGIRVDATAPGEPSNVLIAGGPTSSNDASMNISWTNDPDPILAGVGYCITTVFGGTACGSGEGPTVAVDWTPVSAPATSVLATDLSLTGGQWFACVKSVDTLARESSVVCTSIFIDTIDPSAPTAVNDGVLVSTPDQANLSWTIGSDNAFLAATQYCITTDSDGSDCDGGFGPTVERGWTNRQAPLASVSAESLNMTDGSWFGCVRSIDGAGNVSEPAVCGDGFFVDTVDPTAPSGVVVESGQTYTNDRTSLDISWTDGSDSASYAGSQWCVTQSSNGSNCTGTVNPGKGWTDVSPGGYVFADAFDGPMTDGTWYGCVRSRDQVPRYSAAACDDITVDATAPALSNIFCYGCTAGEPFYNTVRVNASDAGSGLALGSTTATFVANGGGASGSGTGTSCDYYDNTYFACGWDLSGATEGNIFFYEFTVSDIAGNSATLGANITVDPAP